MLNLNLTYTKPQVCINGIVFDVLRSDATIVQDMLDIDAEFAGENIGDPAVVLRKNKRMLEYLDTVLGKGAQKKILGTLDGCKDLGLAGVDSLLGQIVQAAGKAYSDSFALKYDD